jgi:hypothetical protein
VGPGDHDTLSTVLGRVAATLDLAVEFLARGQETQGVAALRGVPLVRLFRLGVSLIGKVRRLGLSLGKQTPFARLGVHGQLFESEDAEVIAAVTRLRPLFPRLLETEVGERPFASLADIAITTAALERAGAAVAMIYGLGVRPEHLAPPALDDAGVELAALDTGILARTALAHRLIGGAPGPLRPLTPADLEKLRPILTKAAGKAAAGAAFGDTIQAILVRSVPAGAITPAMAAVADRWIASMLPMETVLTTRGLERPGLP